jgi:multiple sugar transport system permease protein
VFAATSTWQEFLWPLVVTDTMDMRPVSVGIALFAALHERFPNYQMAAAVVATLPMLVFFLLAQRYLVRGISLTGMKG